MVEEKNTAKMDAMLVKMNEDSLSEEDVAREVDTVIERAKADPETWIPYLRGCLENQIVSGDDVLKDKSLPAALVLGKMLNEGILKDKMDVNIVTQEIEAFEAKRQLLNKMAYIDY